MIGSAWAPLAPGLAQAQRPGSDLVRAHGRPGGPAETAKEMRSLPLAGDLKRVCGQTDLAEIITVDSVSSEVGTYRFA